MHQPSKKELQLYHEQCRSSSYVSEVPHLLGRLPLELVTEFNALPRAKAPYTTHYLGEGIPYTSIEPTGVVSNLRDAFIDLTGSRPASVETRYGWWVGLGDAMFHLDQGAQRNPVGVYVAVVGQPTQCIDGPCSVVFDGYSPEYIPKEGAAIVELEEGGVYRLGPQNMHREPPCIEPQNRLFFRV